MCKTSVHRRKGLSCSSPTSPGDCSNAHSDKKKENPNIYAHKTINRSFKDFLQLLNEECISPLALALT